MKNELIGGDVALLEPKVEPEEADSGAAVPSNEAPDAADSFADVKMDQAEQSDDEDRKPLKKKAKVMLPTIGSPRGLRTLLPGIVSKFRLRFSGFIYLILYTRFVIITTNVF